MTDLILQIGGIEDFDCTLEFYVERDKSIAISKSQLNGVTIGGRTQYYAVIDADRVGRGHLMCRVELNEREGSKMRHVTVSGYTGCTIPCVGTGGHIECSGYRISFLAVQDIPHADGSVLHGVTYAELKAMRDSGNLVPLEKYRITDYVTTTTQEDTMSANHPFDVIVEALTEWDLSERAQVCQHEGDGYFDDANLGAWQIWYDIENDTSKYAWADAENGKGVIYRMIDEHGNDCPYDFKNILFGEWYTFCWQNDYENDFSLSGRCRNNVIKEYYRNSKRALNNVRFNVDFSAGETINCFFDVDCHDICIYGGGINISAGYGSHDLQIDGGAVNVRIGKSCFDISIGLNCDDINIGDSCYNITVPDEYSCIHIGNDCKYIGGVAGLHSKIQIMPGVGGKSNTERLTMQSSDITDDMNVYYADGDGGYYSSSHGDLVVFNSAISSKIDDVEKSVNAEITKEKDRAKEAENTLDEKITNEITRAEEAEKALDEKIETKHNEALDALDKEVEAIKDGDTIVGQAREVYSRTGKTVTDSFLARTTAGSGTVGDGVASLKSVGGNIVKNNNSVKAISGPVEKVGDIILATPNSANKIQFGVNLTAGTTEDLTTISTHKYYNACFVKTDDADAEVVVGRANIDFLYITHKANVTKGTNWQFASCTITSSSSTSVLNFTIGVKGTTLSPLYVKNILHIDLTEMFGAGKEPSKEECDRLFGTMDALPQGLSIAKPTEFKSVGYNQFNPENVLKGKTIDENGVIVDSTTTDIAVIPCLPCKVGTGENNGYCVHGEFELGAESVYLTPLNPLEVEGELYMHELTKDTTTDTYVPQIKGYMLVEVPTTVNLCVHFLWGEDRDKHDYEPYHESKVELPVIPQMSEWGLAGIQSSGTLVCDEIDFERGVYRKKIYAQDLSRGGFWINQREYFKYFLFPAKVTSSGYDIMCERYPSMQGSIDALLDKHIMLFQKRYICIRDDSYTTVEEFNASLDGIYVYYAMPTPEEYPLPKFDNNYISSDYGVELFNSTVPCNANNLYYMRSLVGETRNFLDRMYDNTEKTDAKEVADYITSGIEGNKELATTERNGLMSAEDKNILNSIGTNEYDALSVDRRTDGFAYHVSGISLGSTYEGQTISRDTCSICEKITLTKGQKLSYIAYAENLNAIIITDANNKVIFLSGAYTVADGEYTATDTCYVYCTAVTNQITSNSYHCTVGAFGIKVTIERLESDVNVLQSKTYSFMQGYRELFANGTLNVEMEQGSWIDFGEVGDNYTEKTDTSSSFVHCKVQVNQGTKLKYRLYAAGKYNVVITDLNGTILHKVGDSSNWQNHTGEYIATEECVIYINQYASHATMEHSDYYAILVDKDIRPRIDIKASDSEIEIWHKLKKAYLAGGYDVYFEYATYTFKEIYDVWKEINHPHLEMPIGGGCNYYCNGATFISVDPDSGHVGSRATFGVVRSVQSFCLQDANIVCIGGSYCFHDEGQNKEGYYLHKYVNCKMKYIANEHTTYLGKPFGGGMGLRGDVVIDNCYFENTNTIVTNGKRAYPVSWHGNLLTDSPCTFNLSISNSYFVGGFVELGGNEKNQGDTNTLYLSNNNADTEPYISETGNWTTYIWNNVIR